MAAGLQQRLSWKSRFRTALLYSIGVPFLNLMDRIVARGSVVGNAPVLDNKTFAWSADIEANWHTIRDELLGAAQDSQLPSMHQIASDLSHMTTDDGWKTLILFAYGHDSERNCNQCPATTRLMRQIPGIKNALFSVLAPGKHIPRHRGEYKGLIRCHLGLVIPAAREQCRMLVADNNLVVWREGELVIFDNSYHHEVWNDTDETRVILLFDIVRPMRFPFSLFNNIVIRLIQWSPYVRKARENLDHWESKQKSVDCSSDASCNAPELVNPEASNQAETRSPESTM